MISDLFKVLESQDWANFLHDMFLVGYFFTFTIELHLKQIEQYNFIYYIRYMCLNSKYITFLGILF